MLMRAELLVGVPVVSPTVQFPVVLSKMTCLDVPFVRGTDARPTGTDAAAVYTVIANTAVIAATSAAPFSIFRFISTFLLVEVVTGHGDRQSTGTSGSQTNTRPSK